MSTEGPVRARPTHASATGSALGADPRLAGDRGQAAGRSGPPAPFEALGFAGIALPPMATRRSSVIAPVSRGADPNASLASAVRRPAPNTAIPSVSAAQASATAPRVQTPARPVAPGNSDVTPVRPALPGQAGAAARGREVQVSTVPRVVELSSDLETATIADPPPTARAKALVDSVNPALEAEASRAANPAQASSGFEIPGYRLLRLLGKGGMGEVYLADKVGSAGVAVRCVVKTIISASGSDAQFRDLFLNEARIVSQLRHPNIVSVLDVGQAADRLYLAMEWIDGLDATGLLVRASTQKADLPLRHVLYILRDTLQGLHHAHTAVSPDGVPLRIVHRDISPGNILISRQGAVKLADFGVALGETARNQGAGRNLAGKPHYFAPELWVGEPASIQTDIFALGVTFYEMLSLRPLFGRDLNMTQIMNEIRSFDPQGLLDEDLTIPEGVEHIILKSLASSPANRYATALEFLEDVNDYAYENGIRLLDAHFASYISKTLDSSARSSGSGTSVG